MQTQFQKLILTSLFLSIFLSPSYTLSLYIYHSHTDKTHAQTQTLKPTLSPSFLPHTITDKKLLQNVDEIPEAKNALNYWIILRMFIILVSVHTHSYVLSLCVCVSVRSNILFSNVAKFLHPTAQAIKML